MTKNLFTKIIFSAIFLLMGCSVMKAQSVAIDSAETQSPPAKSLREIIYRQSQTNPLNQQTSNNYVRPEANQRFKRYLNRTVGIGLIGVGIGAGIQQIANVPPEWERTGKGFARRLGSNFGENAIEETVAYGVEEALKLDSKFYKSQKRDFRSRFKNALLSGITARTPSGRRVFNPAPIIGTYTANIISTETWYPERYSYKDGLRQGTRNLGFTIGFGFLNEFILNRK